VKICVWVEVVCSGFVRHGLDGDIVRMILDCRYQSRKTRPRKKEFKHVRWET
jgi:hypothetical protein